MRSLLMPQQIRIAGRNFGYLRAMDNLGAVCGIVLCIVFFWYLNIGYRQLFLFAALPSIIGAIVVILFIKERQLETKKIFKRLSFKDLNRNFKMFLLLSAIFALGSFSYSFLLIYAKQFGFEVIFVPVLYLVFTVFAAVGLGDGGRPGVAAAVIGLGLVGSPFVVGLGQRDPDDA